MPTDTPSHLRCRQLGAVTIVGFDTPYLQTEDLVEKIGADLNKLVAEEKPTKLILSFDGVRFLSSSMLAQVVKLHKSLAKTKARLRICGLAPAIREVLHASQLDRLLDVHDDENAALEKF
jgi:anti-sigma B factor antagonist